MLSLKPCLQIRLNDLRRPIDDRRVNGVGGDLLLIFLCETFSEHRREGNKGDDSRPGDSAIDEHFFGDFVMNGLDVEPRLEIERRRGKLKIQRWLFRTVTRFTFAADTTHERIHSIVRARFLIQTPVEVIAHHRSSRDGRTIIDAHVASLRNERSQRCT